MRWQKLVEYVKDTQLSLWTKVAHYSLRVHRMARQKAGLPDLREVADNVERAASFHPDWRGPGVEWFELFLSELGEE